MVPALFDTSTGLFLIFKILWEDYGIELESMLIILTTGSILIWIRTFFLVPYRFLDKNKTILEQSFFGSNFKDQDAVKVKDDSFDMYESYVS